MDTAAAGLLIHWILEGVVGAPGAAATSRLASTRYRAILPSRWLQENGHRIEFIDQQTWRARQTDPPADVVVIGKLPSGGDRSDLRRQVGEHVLAQAGIARQLGVALVADFNDDHFDHPTLASYWRSLAQAVDVCVVGSEAIAETLRRWTDRPVVRIDDPLGSPRGEPRVFRRRPALARALGRLLPGHREPPLRLAWYGNGRNWPAMQAWAEQLAPLARQQAFRLRAVVGPLQPSAKAAVEDFNGRHGAAASIELTPWSESAQWSVVAESDAVLIPADATDPTGASRTNNRLTDALHAGRAVVASPLPSYMRYAEVAMLTERPLDALQAYLADPDAALRILRQGQTLAAEAAGPSSVGKAWLTSFEQARAAAQSRPREPATAQKPPATEAATPAVRFNLGCGDKILPGFINVDLSGNWSGREPDVVADVTGPLPFEDAMADEVHAYHVLEHLLRWKVEDCLREWLRVLKPGGQLILEMPCLDKVLRLMNHYAQQGKAAEPRLTIWALYGDPGYRVEAMMHRWCYSVDELTRILTDLGLQDIREEEPQTHIRIRDMRVVATKPPA